MSRVLLAHPGTQHARHLAVQLQKQSLLYKFFTGFVLPLDLFIVRMLFRMLPTGIQKKIRNRLLAQVPLHRLKMFPLLEWSTLRALKNGNRFKEEIFYERNKLFQEKIADKFILNADVIIGFDTSSWILAEKAKKLNKVFILDQTTAEAGVKNEILQQVARTYPAWKFDTKPRFKKLIETDIAERSLAHRIIVASTYAKNSLVQAGTPAEKIIINPYGTDLEFFVPSRTPKTGVVKFLFVGSITALKGIPMLLQAWEELGEQQSQLSLVGPLNAEASSLIGNRKSVTVMGPVPQQELPRLYQSCDVLILPSFSDGFGQVLLEALACGLPVIATANTAAPDLITHGEHGFIIPTGDVTALRSAMEFFIVNQPKISNMSKAARIRAEQYSWSSYGERWKNILTAACHDEKNVK